MASNKFLRFYNFLANMGLVIRDDPPKEIDLTGREWGESVGGIALSIRELKREEPGQVAGISVVMRNGGTEPITLNVPQWVYFYEIAGLDLSPYGQQLMNAERRTANVDVMLKPGDAIETHLPVSTVYSIRPGGFYKLQVSCRLPENGRANSAVLRSNEIAVRV